MKALTIGGLLLLLMIPLTMLRGLVYERQARASEVRHEIAASTSRPQTLSGPLLRVRIEHVHRHLLPPATPDAEAKEQLSTRIESRLIAPDSLDIASQQRTERRHRGLFNAVLYHDDISLRATFTPPRAPDGDETLITWRITHAALVLGVGDSRGIRALRMSANGATVDAMPGTGVSWLAEGVHALVPLHLLDKSTLDVDATLGLTGTSSLSFNPVGGDTRVEMNSDWPHPGFGGNRLPESRTLNAQGFHAIWTVSRLASQAHQIARGCSPEAELCAGFGESAFGVTLVEPVDRHQQTERAMKYALLFLLLIFGAVFLTEALATLQVHPLQYALTGLALSMFFLLLLALAEHSGFGLAYVLAASACVALISAYMSPVLHSRKRCGLFAALLASLYVLLYGLLQSEDHALLIGSMALFALLAVAMLLTRRLDWNRFGTPADAFD